MYRKRVQGIFICRRKIYNYTKMEPEMNHCDGSGGVSGSCLIYGIKRGLYSNEAGVGSAPNASASAHVSHPVKQGLVQTLSV